MTALEVFTEIAGVDEKVEKWLMLKLLSTVKSEHGFLIPTQK